MAKRVNSGAKARRDLKIAEIVYYTIGGFFLLTGFVFCILGVILINPPQENFANSPLYLAETTFFNSIGWDTTFLGAGSILMLLSIIYFMIVFYIFAKKGDDVNRREEMKSHRQREIIIEAPQVKVEETVTESK